MVRLAFFRRGWRWPAGGSSLLGLVTGLAASLPLGGPLAAAEITIARSPQGAVVHIDGRLFTEYRTSSGNKPILWPIIGPTGQAVTRSFPMGAAAGETQDHPHHRSLWFSHGDVDGLSFWHERDGGPTIRHKKFVQVRGDTIETENEWLDPTGRPHLQDRRTLRFGADDADHRWIDFDITLTAGERAVWLGDTKEGSFGVRVAGTMKVTAGGGGRIVSSTGQEDKAAWGKRAAWVDYHGPVEGQMVGIAILNHPRSFRFPTFWHVRPYGLFAANPFGLRDFTAGQKEGGYQLQAGESITLRYRVWLHRGDHREGKVAEAFQAYARQAAPPDE